MTTNTKHCLIVGRKTKYFVNAMDLLHRFLAFLFPSRSKGKSVEKIERILLCNWSSLGDVVVASSVVPTIKAHFPACKIGFLVSRDSAVVLQTCAGIDWIHKTVTPSGQGLRRLFNIIYLSLTEWKRTVGELKKNNYDCAIELYPYFPNVISILWRAKIPMRIGFNSGGNSLLLSTSVMWKGNHYFPHLYSDLLAHLGIPKTQSPRAEIIAPQSSTLKLNVPYYIFHVCSSDCSKELSVAFWQFLYNRCKMTGIAVYFTGRGQREKAIIERIGITKSENLCDCLTWPQLVKVIQGAKGVVSVDSVPVHIAASLSVPFAVLYVRPYSPLWYPASSHSIAFGVHAPVDPEAVFNTLQTWK